MKEVQRDDGIVETVTDVCGLYFRSVLLPKKGIAIEQHIHDYSHANYCGSGAAEFWADGAHVRDVKAGDAIEVKAGVYHVFIALEDNTRLTCVHNLSDVKESGHVG